MAWQGEVFQGQVGFTMEDSKPHWDLPPRPPEGTPNVLMIVLDDVGFGHLSCYGGQIETPNMDALAANGLRYTNWHTCALCSPTRSCLLTGRNHHTNGMGLISELASGYPGYDGMPKASRAYIPQILQAKGFTTFALGKWHQCPAEEMSTAGPYTRWPTQKGFDRYYGFLGAETDQFSPDLVYDNHYVDPPKTPEEGYHLTEDITDKAIGFLRDLRSADPTKPFFMYFCPGAMHAPHQAPREWIEKYQGKFDAGWDAYREETHKRQLEMGIIPANTELSARPDWVRAWDTLNADEKKLYAHMMEIFAGFLSHTDFHIGRLIAAMDKLGDLDNTLIMVVSDNGASGEGGYFGSFNENLIFNGVPDSFEENFKRIDELGGPNSYGHYPTGWTMAGNTPFKRWKRNAFNGGIADPCIVSWRNGIAARGEIRNHYSHAIDLPATILDILAIEPPTMFNGIPQEAIAGKSIRSTFETAQAKEVRAMQYYEVYGSRALYMNGWKAVTFHPVPGVPSDGPGDPDMPFMQDKWELYNVAQDFSEVHDLAEKEPDRLQMMIGMWFAEAGKYDVFPIHAYQAKAQRPKPFPARNSYTYWPHTTHIDNEAAVNVRMRPFSVVAYARVPQGAEGVLIAQGGRFAGWSFFIKDGKLIYEHNYLGLERYRVVSDEPVPVGDMELGMEFHITGKFDITPSLSAMGFQGVNGEVTLFINRQAVGTGHIAKTVPFGWSLSGEGLCCGYDSETPVSELYEAPFKFTGGIERVVVSVSGEPYTFVSKEVENAFIIQ